MPTYQYRCTECGHDLEAVQKFTDAALTECPNCHGQLRKIFNAVGVVFKGSGFYRTDSRTGGGSDSGKDSSSGSGSGKETAGKDSGGKESAGKSEGTKTSGSDSGSSSGSGSSGSGSSSSGSGSDGGKKSVASGSSTGPKTGSS